MDGTHTEIQGFTAYTLARIEATPPQTVQFKMGASSSAVFWVPDLLRIVTPGTAPSLRGPPLGCVAEISLPTMSHTGRVTRRT